MVRWLVNLAIALLFAALLGLVLERIAIRPMVGQSLLPRWRSLRSASRSRFGPVQHRCRRPRGSDLAIPWGNETFGLFGGTIPKSFIAAIIAGILSFLVVFVFYRSKLGIAMRAVAFDQEAAMAQGINVGRVFAIAWGFGSALAALGAIFFGMSGWPPNGAVSGETHPILAFRVLPVIILGGLDSVSGAVYGGLIIASFEIFAGEYLSQWNNVLGSGYSTIVPYLVMLVVLIVKPYGLFGTEEIRRV
ncbi:MAG: branched-chain amino acid ABC transporter permease [Acidimicrobiales bacterium]